ncbi:hypothetical protein K4G53_11725 [Arthrobacter sp. MAHUQ-56]|nr:hypothetical protein [Arthrobacter sp. MAHUQ-56]
MALIAYGIFRAGWSVWLPVPSEMERSRVGNLYVYGGCALSLAAAVWSHTRGNPVWVSVCVGLPGILLAWATMNDPYHLTRHLAAVVTFPLALGGVADVIWVRGYRKRR